MAAGMASGADPSRGGAAAQVIEVPVAAVFSPDEATGSFVWVIDRESMTVNRRAVTVESLSAGGIRVLEGLAIGDWIAIAGVNFLREGQQIRILESEGA